MEVLSNISLGIILPKQMSAQYIHFNIGAYPDGSTNYMIFIIDDEASKIVFGLCCQSNEHRAERIAALHAIKYRPAHIELRSGHISGTQVYVQTIGGIKHMGEWCDGPRSRVYASQSPAGPANVNPGSGAPTAPPITCATNARINARISINNHIINHINADYGCVIGGESKRPRKK